jgi:PKD repeat protein
MRSKILLFLILVCCFSMLVRGQNLNLVTYAGNSGDDRFYSVVQLSDSTYLVAGSSDNLNWLPSGVTQKSISTTAIHNSLKTVKKVGYILHINGRMTKILDVLYFPAGTVQDIRHIKLSNTPGSATSNIYISGTTIDSRANAGGYFLAKLNNNYVSGTPTGISWAYNVYATDYYQSEQPWDVGSDGKIIFVAGTPYGSDSCAVLRLKTDGSGLDIVDQWRTHYGTNVATGAVVGGEWTPSTANPNVQTLYSALLMSDNNTCELRSWTSSQYSATLNDENGGTKKGTWPLDAFFSSACDTSKPAKTSGGPGYTGYSYGSVTTMRVGAITIDRRDNSFYIGASTQASLSSGLSDEEPFVMAFNSDGGLKWWDRLHKENSSNSPAPQEVTAMGIDYSQSGYMAAVVVAATTQGSGANDLWAGNSIVNNPLNPGYAFHNAYTGTAQVTVGWVGRLRLTNGDLLNSSYLSGYDNSDPLTQAKYTEPTHDNWASHNAGTPKLGTTSVEIDMQIDDFGRVYTLATTTRAVTTSNAYQKMSKPSAAAPTTTAYLRVYEGDLSKLAYASALTGVWSTSTGSGGGNTTLKGVFPVYNGAVIVGYHHDDDHNKTSDGNSIPLSHVPSWGNSSPKAEEAIFAHLAYDTVLKAYFKVNPKSGICVGQSVTFTDTSLNATSWSWSFGAGASTSTATGKGPHTITYSSADTVLVQLVVSDGTNHDTATMKYIITSTPSSSFSTSGTTTSAPDTISFSGPSGSGYSYSWDFGDPSSGGDNTSTLQNPTHIYQLPGNYTATLIVTKGNCTSKTTKSITITGGLGAADATFTVSSNPGCLNQPITFTQTDPTNSVEWSWVFGKDATPQTSNTAGPHTVTYASAGGKNAMLTVSNGVQKQTKVVTFNIASPPSASFYYTGDLTSLPTTLIFHGSTCGSCSYLWDFNDPGSGTDDTSSQSETTHKFMHDGNYYVTYTVKDANGCTTTTKQSITISGSVSYRSQYADFTIAPTQSTCVGNKVRITDMSNNVTNFTKWYFGDGAVPATASFNDTPTVYWTTPGVKNIVLITGTSGNSDAQKQKSVYYTVTDYPDATFTYSGTTTSAPATVSFTANEGQGYLYSWDFGDPGSGSANTSNNSAPSHNYTTSGTYTVTLAITHNGCTTYYSTNVYIGVTTPAIIPAFSIKPSKNGCMTPTVVVTDASQGLVSSYNWQFGSTANPTSKTTQGPHTITYSTPGPKTIRLTIGNGVISQTVTMNFNMKF